MLNKEYKVVRPVENGAEGEKKLVHHVNDENEKKDLFLVKILPCSKTNDFERYEREIRVMKALDHKNIAKVVKAEREGGNLLVFFKYYEKGSLSDIFNDKSRLDEDECRRYFKQILEAVEYCHNNNIVHRDIKPDNM